MQKQAQPPFHTASAESERWTEISSERRNTNERFDLMDGWFCLYTVVMEAVAEGKKPHLSPLIYSGLIGHVSGGHG